MEVGDRYLRLVEVLAEVADDFPDTGEFVALVERLRDRGRFADSGLARSPRTLTVSVAAPLPRPAALAGDRHRAWPVTIRDETVRTLVQVYGV